MACSNGKFIFVWKCLKINFIFCIFIALLAGTLRTYQKAGCDAEYIALSCPRGTSISIEIAQYGNTLKGNCCSFWIHLDFIWKSHRIFFFFRFCGFIWLVCIISRMFLDIILYLYLVTVLTNLCCGKVSTNSKFRWQKINWNEHWTYHSSIEWEKMFMKKRKTRKNFQLK